MTVEENSKNQGAWEERAEETLCVSVATGGAERVCDGVDFQGARRWLGRGVSIPAGRLRHGGGCGRRQ
ncbi:unnamed protein product [Arctia plantaginis]|uniref:Uncharacterized protein n=1 Tax=Arctia plantaginis TaxID=874455 RepID=A0A8S1AXA7_ARCPL|nr:unnamed protein product [Arctia plantaginis]